MNSKENDDIYLVLVLIFYLFSWLYSHLQTCLVSRMLRLDLECRERRDTVNLRTVEQ